MIAIAEESLVRLFGVSVLRSRLKFDAAPIKVRRTSLIFRVFSYQCQITMNPIHIVIGKR